MRLFSIAAVTALLIIPILLLGAGCATTDGGSGGWIVVDSPSKTTAPSRKAPTDNTKGLEVAAANHLRTAYRFLQKDKPDHAMRELEKARAKMGQDYWYSYYLGGAFYLKAQYTDAVKSWNIAYRYTGDPSLRSRIATCLSFAEYRINGRDRSIELLGKAVDLDSKNSSAREFLDDLKKNPWEEQASKPGSKGKKDKTGKGAGKSGKQDKRIQDRDQFKTYFLVEMPKESSNAQSPTFNGN